MRVGVLRGGIGPEYDISLKTGSSVLKALPSPYKPKDVLITKDGVWHVDGLPIQPANLTGKVDVVYNALHGEYGEDGQVQKLLDNLGISYTGSGHYASAMGMNKLKGKEVCRELGFKSPLHLLITDDDDISARCRDVFLKISPPWIIKPVNSGSSVGLRYVTRIYKLEEAVREVLSVFDAVIVEEYIKGREAVCGVLDDYRGHKHYPLIPVEIVREQKLCVLSYETKYTCRIPNLCPGPFSPDEKASLQDMAVKLHQALGARHYSKLDFIVSRRGIYFLEINTLPWLETESPFCLGLEAVGCRLPQFLDHAIQLAIKRN
jgi:D-alanine-D-alanine ligase